MLGEILEIAVVETLLENLLHGWQIRHDHLGSHGHGDDYGHDHAESQLLPS